ncbi:MAG: alpha/beta hydrolase [Actinomycetota bacterium]|nr:alpha/beta hydrolase [Actinomycetota bacterium]
MLIALVPVAAAQQPSGAPSLYCEGDGGPLGAATDLEHEVLLGEAPLPAGLRSSRVSVDGVSTRVVEGGPASAREAVVFVHGNPGSARDFDELLAAAGAFTRTVAFDMSGYGESDHFAPQVQSLEGAARFIGRALEELGIRRAVLVMHDFGGPWSIPWAIEHPDAFIGAVVMNSGVLIDYFPHPYAWIWSMPGAGELQMASTTRSGFSRTLQMANPRGLPQDYVDRMYDNYDRATRCAALRYYRSAIRVENAGLARQQADALRKHPRPALVIWGEKDIFIPPKHAQDQREAFPDAQIHMLEDSGHWPFIDAPERTRALFVSFLRPRLVVPVPRARVGARRVKVRVRTEGLLPGYEVQARLGTAGRSAPRTVGGWRTLVVRLRRPLRAGRHVVTVGARGLTARMVAFRVAPRAR